MRYSLAVLCAYALIGAIAVPVFVIIIPASILLGTVFYGSWVIFWTVLLASYCWRRIAALFEWKKKRGASVAVLLPVPLKK